MLEGSTLVFVDALAEIYLEQHRASLSFLSDMDHRRGIEPGLGFSVNIKAELLAGLTPDDLGFFCKWSYSERPSWRLPGWARSLGQAFDGSQFSSRVAHRLLSRAVGLDLFTIPFDEIDLFEPVRIPEAYEEGFPRETLLDRHDFQRISHGRGTTDDSVAATALAALTDPARNVYVSLIEPDAVGHRQGPASEAMAAKLADTDAHLARLYAAHERAGRGAFVVFSDHGMSPVTSKPWFDPREALGPPGRDRYAWFSDSTMLRFWFFDSAIQKQAEALCAEIPWGGVLRAEERARFGVASPVHGDLLVLADEGVIPCPSYVGGKHPRAVGMHGYHPDLASQRGLVAWQGAAAGVPDNVVARDFPAAWSAIVGLES